MGPALPFMSVIAPMAIYQTLQDIASVEGAQPPETITTRERWSPGMAWERWLCGAAGSIVSPVVYALHPPYKAMGARIGFALWTPVLVLLIVMRRDLTMWIAQLFPWSILAAMIAYIAIGVGTATLHRVDRKYLERRAARLRAAGWSGRLRGREFRAAGAAASAANPAVQAALNGSIYWSSVQGLGNGFLFLVLVVSALITEIIDRNFGRAAIWCLLAAVFAWFGLMHSPGPLGARSPCMPRDGSRQPSSFPPPAGGAATSLPPAEPSPLRTQECETCKPCRSVLQKEDEQSGHSAFAGRVSTASFLRNFSFAIARRPGGLRKGQRNHRFLLHRQSVLSDGRDAATICRPIFPI